MVSNLSESPKLLCEHRPPIVGGNSGASSLTLSEIDKLMKRGSEKEAATSKLEQG